ncbi:hypothetical protein UFOVP1295_48 [uncultured Caudovirales phage]|uniref:Uncharacterized protein n=1 Tax=uncultured Caudovirales phage TaxID=2100421 RepID=A0A6J5RQK9_9CAUD|nr:hypothetical protein UFOVP1295_48 [uncultured Caudovirales phage]
MAYPSITAPYGLRPINLIGGQVFAGATRQIPIGSGNDTAIYYGDVVKLDSSGLLQKDVGTDAATPVGVFLGCTYTDSQYGLTFRQFYAADTVAGDITAYVTDDPDALYKVAVVSATTTIGYVNRTAVGNNAVLVQNAGSTLTGNSAVAVNATTATTATFPIRIIDVVPETAIAGYPGSYTEVVVKWNAPNVTSQVFAGGHQYLNPLGV